MNKSETLLISLIASTVDNNINRCLSLLPAKSDIWKGMSVLASMQGVTGLALSAIELLPRELYPPIEILMDMAGMTERQREKFGRQVIIAQRFAHALREKGVEMKILKGISFSTYYDQPELRECGDCDCYLSLAPTPSFQSKRQAGSTGFVIGNKTIEEIGGKAEFGSYKHSHLYLNGLMFENHHYITDFNGTKQGKKTEMLLEEAIDTPGTPIRLTLYGKTKTTDMMRPCAHFCALHCLRHAQGNLMSGGMVLRMLYDWTMIMRAEQENLDWERLGKALDEMRLRLFAGVMTSVCEKYLGLKLSAKGVIRCEDETLTDEVMLDTLRSDIHPKKKESLWHKGVRICKRFKKFYHFRRLATESVPMMIYNSFAFSSYMRRNIEL